jgi:ABC-type phosphate/phosphonate transport system permease subunit
MKSTIKVLVVCVLLALIAWALVFISGEENSISMSNDWGIAKDHPRR